MDFKLAVIISLINFITVSPVHGKNVAKKKECNDSLEVDGKHHKKHVLASDIFRPYQLAYYNHSHKLFFSYNLEEGADETFALAYLNTSKPSGHARVGGVKNGFATAVDEHGRAVYFGGSDGIYKYHPDAKENNVTRIVHEVNVWDMFYHNRTLYYITYPRQRLYSLKVHENDMKPDEVETVPEEVYQFAIDGKDDMFFTNDTGAYRLKNGKKDRMHSRGETKFRAVAVDRKGEVHFGGRHGIFVVHEDEHKNHTLREIAHVRNLFGLTFDENNHMIYADYREIVILRDVCDK